MDNLYKQVRMDDGKIYTVIAEYRNRITCIFEECMQTLSFRTAHDLKQYMENHSV